ncbi:hypothetical protein M409DRAFT_65372 [Zasmidium cellare ATCC 36951]|uniref:PinX1-related protein 1 n=1 Tax=Zasmidium cellare ATCC 36951 TaxID=1080233 RepID=A0A6A6CUD2_ZASCE|nr:uncharacterized protein M409DRAFT_65372 [Zasmidium cellare ATCC 36951]KAF2169086.1 hypothetical protein M409DRAFT_65372 [Zasmidium cellare ATCC 36951]
MGLSGNKTRSKLSHDPNNTAWSKNTANFGHKILSKQGWKQGDFLGAENANHSDHFTAANASHIRVMLREDNLGLGAQIGKGNAETFGLNMFSGLLGRLNGKSDEEVQKKQDTIRDAELRAYQANKYGFMNFVRGGLLVGDKMEFPESTKIEDVKKTSKSIGAEAKQSKKRKAGEDEDVAESSKKRRKSESKSSRAASEIAVDAASKKSEERKKQKSISEEESQDTSSSSESGERGDARKEKRRRKEQRKAAKDSKEPAQIDEDEEKARLKAEKRALKEERRKRREEKRTKRAAKEGAKGSAQPSTATSESEGTATPPVMNGGLTMTGGRHAVRQRYIMQKRMASMNATALKEIFMLKPQPAS